MQNKCVKCGMNSGWLPVCPICTQNDILKDQNRLIKSNSKDYSGDDLKSQLSSMLIFFIIAVVCFTVVYISYLFG